MKCFKLLVITHVNACQHLQNYAQNLLWVSGVVCWGSRLRVADTNWLKKLIRKASDVVGMECDWRWGQRGRCWLSYGRSWTASHTHFMMCWSDIGVRSVRDLSHLNAWLNTAGNHSWLWPSNCVTPPSEWFLDFFIPSEHSSLYCSSYTLFIFSHTYFTQCALMYTVCFKLYIALYILSFIYVRTPFICICFLLLCLQGPPVSKNSPPEVNKVFWF